MEKKTIGSYVQVFERIKSHILQSQLIPKVMIIDHDVDLKEALSTVFPGVRLMGSWFHHNQVKNYATCLNIFKITNTFIQY